MMGAISRGTVGWDMDRTLARTPPIAMAYLKREYGVDPDMARFRRGGVTAAYPTLSRPQLHEALAYAWRAPDLVPLMDPRIPQILDAVHKEAGFNNAVVTASFGKAENIRWWITQNHIPIANKDFFHVGGERADAKLAIPGITLFVDDSISGARKAGAAGKPYLWANLDRDVDEEVRVELLAYPSIVEVCDLMEVPLLLTGKHPSSERVAHLLAPYNDRA